MRLGWRWFGGDRVGDENEHVGKPYHRAGLKCCSKNFGFYHLCVGGLLQILMEFVLSINGCIYLSHGDCGEANRLIHSSKMKGSGAVAHCLVGDSCDLL